MTNPTLANLSSFLPGDSIQSLASHFGASPTTIGNGIQSSIAAIVSGLAQRSGDQGFLSQFLKSASSTPDNAVSSALSSGALTNPSSSFLTSGSQVLSSIFGGRLGSITEALGSQTGLRGAGVSALLVLGLNTVMGLVGSKVREGSLTASNFPSFLARESEALKGFLPAGFHPQPVPVAAQIPPVATPTGA